MATTNSDTKVVTGEVRLSYAHIFEPFGGDDDNDPKYSTVILIPKEDTATLKRIKKAQAAAAKGKFGDKIPKNLQNTLHDGDEEADLEKNPEYQGHYYMSISSKTKPGVVDKDVDPILDSSEVYSGCYARVSMNCYGYDYKGKKGVSFGLNHVQKLRDGDFLGGRTRAEDDFDEWDDDDEGDDLI